MKNKSRELLTFTNRGRTARKRKRERESRKLKLGPVEPNNIPGVQWNLIIYQGFNLILLLKLNRKMKLLLVIA